MPGGLRWPPPSREFPSRLIARSDFVFVPAHGVCHVSAVSDVRLRLVGSDDWPLGSDAAGVGHELASAVCVCRFAPPSRPSRPSPVVIADVGVAHAFVASVSVVPGCRFGAVPVRSPLDAASIAVAVGQRSSAEDEHALPTVRRPNGLSARKRELRIEPEPGQVAEHFGESASVLDSEEPTDVLKEHEWGSRRLQYVHHGGPKPSGVVASAALPGGRCGLARKPGADKIDVPGEVGRGELPDVAQPDRARSQGAALHRCRQTRGAERLDLQSADAASIEAQASKSGGDADFESADACEKAEDADGGMIHIHRTSTRTLTPANSSSFRCHRF